MGGALSLAFATRTPASPGLDKLKGVLACAPLLRQAVGARAPAVLVRAGSIIGMIAPKMQLKTEVNPSAICRDPVVQAAYAADPLCAPIGSYKGVADMLLGGETLVARDYKNWPANLPLLVLHGTGDLVTDHDASAEFVRKVKEDGKDVDFKSYEGASPFSFFSISLECTLIPVLCRRRLLPRDAQRGELARARYDVRY